MPSRRVTPNLPPSARVSRTTWPRTSLCTCSCCQASAVSRECSTAVLYALLHAFFSSKRATGPLLISEIALVCLPVLRLVTLLLLQVQRRPFYAVAAPKVRSVTHAHLSSPPPSLSLTRNNNTPCSTHADSDVKVKIVGHHTLCSLRSQTRIFIFCSAACCL